MIGQENVRMYVCMYGTYGTYGTYGMYGMYGTGGSGRRRRRVGRRARLTSTLRNIVERVGRASKRENRTENQTKGETKGKIFWKKKKKCLQKRSTHPCNILHETSTVLPIS
ncbi:hypothetical protein AA313_de0203024 [Arthrobotrys entomopaga]|nr:hypothetical protein AA313_de0203024 [Arthrobotrys entomopaga]